MKKPRVWFSLCAVVSAACAGEPFHAREEASPAEAPAVMLDRPVGTPELIPLPAPRLAFARKGASQVVTFDAASGRVIASTVVGDVVLDMVRDADRLLVATSTDDLETSTVRAFRLGGSGLTFLGESEPLGPGARLFPFGSRTLVLTEDMAVIWSLLDDELALVPSSKAIARPASLLSTRAHGAPQLLALSPTGFEGGEHFDTLVVARFDSGWKLDFHSVAAPGRPSSRIGHAPERDEAWLVRKHAKEPAFELGELSVVEPVPPAKLRSVLVPGGVGAIEAVEVDAEREALVVLLSREASTGALALVPLRAGAEPVLAPLSAPVESSEWFSRALAVSASGRVLVATTHGLEGFALTGTAAAPGLARVAELDHEELSAPVVAAD